MIVSLTEESPTVLHVAGIAPSGPVTVTRVMSVAQSIRGGSVSRTLMSRAAAWASCALSPVVATSFEIVTE